MIKLFAGSISASNNKGAFSAPVSLPAGTKEEALGLLYEEARRVFPAKDGWRNHVAAAVEFDDAAVERAYLSIQEEKNQSTEVG